jgi:histo-blood group ABO system transferase
LENSNSIALCCVVGGEVYERYAEDLRTSFFKYFFPSSKQAHFFIISGEEGWPNGTMYRWHRLLENMPETDYVFLCDADMRFENTVGNEIISEFLTLTLHPGYVNQPRFMYPYEKNPNSACYVAQGHLYFCGGFAGGPRKEIKRFANEIASRIDQDVIKGIIPRWHDESALNKVATLWPHFHVLDPSYCYPDNDTYYHEHIWKVPYQRKLVALDKTGRERGNR